MHEYPHYKTNTKRFRLAVTPNLATRGARLACEAEGVATRGARLACEAEGVATRGAFFVLRQRSLAHFGEAQLRDT